MSKAIKYNYDIERDSRDCDGPMYHKPIIKDGASHEELLTALGEFCMSYHSVSKHYEGYMCIFIGYTHTEEGFNRGQFRFSEEESEL